VQKIQIPNDLTPVRKRTDPLQPGPGEGDRYNLVPFSKPWFEKGSGDEARMRYTTLGSARE